MESSNSADHNTNVLDKQMVITSSITDHKENIPEQDVILWNEYKDYLDVKVSKITASNLIRYAKNYYYVLLTNKVSDLSLLTQEKRIHVMKALSSPPSKFLGVHQKWKKLIENFDLKWTNNQTANSIFFRIFDNHSNDDINKMILWLKEALDQLPKKYSSILS